MLILRTTKQAQQGTGWGGWPPAAYAAPFNSNSSGITDAHGGGRHKLRILTNQMVT